MNYNRLLRYIHFKLKKIEIIEIKSIIKMIDKNINDIIMNRYNYYKQCLRVIKIYQSCLFHIILHY